MMERRATPAFETHTVDNQPPEFAPRDLWSDDGVLREGCTREGAGDFAAALQAYGAQAGSELYALGFDANRDKPRLKTHDRFGHRIDLVEFHPAYHQLLHAAKAGGVAGLSWHTPRPGAHVARAALSYLHHQAEAGTSCPLTMTHAAVPVLRREPALREWADKAAAPHYDPRDVPIADKTGGNRPMSTPIEDYAMLGNCRSAALVTRAGSIDWLCLPRFDSDAVFAALLGTPEHGRWLLCPADETARSQRSYRDGSLVLDTIFETDRGQVLVTDFMVASHNGEVHNHLVRRVEALRGKVPMHTELVMRFGYGLIVPWVTQQDDGLRAVAGPDQLLLRTPLTIDSHDMVSTAEFTLEPGQSTWFVLSHGASHLEQPPALEVEEALQTTLSFWEDWSSRCADAGPWSAQVKRSLVVLKGLSYLPTGAIVAAPTASLPESLGGERNWDYRYCWLRDSSFTLLALTNAGYREEAAAFRDWVKRAVAGTPGQLQALYGVGGERRLPEWVADWLPGYGDSRPVNLGNAAAKQFQLDVYGELIGMLEAARLRGMESGESGIELERAFLIELEQRWHDPDEGIWEVRSGRRHFTHSKLMAWRAFDLAAQNEGSFCAEDRARWREQATQVHADILANALHPDGYFVQSYGGEALDAALLLMPLTGFLPPDDPRLVATVEAIRDRLTVDGLVQRYATEQAGDGLPDGEGTFLACSFWLVEALAIIGHTDQALERYTALLALCNDVGLLAEEYDPRGRRMLGNFPQGYSHVALVNAAYRLNNLHDIQRTSTEIHA